MKRILKKIISYFLMMLMLVPNTVAFAAEEKTDVQTLQENISVIEEELAENGTDVISEISEMIVEYNEMLNGTVNDEEKQQIAGLISTLEENLSEYRCYNEGIVIDRKIHPIYTPAVSAVIAYFNSNGYKLAAELLTHAEENTKLNSTYNPRYGSLVKKSATFKKIANGEKTKGSDSFSNIDGTVNKDLYYAIHKFDFTKPSKISKKVTIKGRYDFKKGEKYSGLAGLAIDTMYAAQEAGFLVPYYVSITETL